MARKTSTRKSPRKTSVRKHKAHTHHAKKRSPSRKGMSISCACKK